MGRQYYHAMAIAEVLAQLQTSLEGLSQEESSQRLVVYGLNTLKEEISSKRKIFFRQFRSSLVYVLIAASCISVFLGEIADFFVINAIICLNAIIGFWQEWKAETSIASLKKMTEHRCKVLRNNQWESIGSSTLVPGDFLLLREGEVVPCDVRLIETSGLMVDESSLTGESFPVLKNHLDLLVQETSIFERTNELLAGTTIVRGMGKGIVIATGKSTYLGLIAEKAQQQSKETPLTKALHFFTKGYLLLLVLLFLLLGVVGVWQGRSILELSYILLASLVSAVPEGLPIVLTLVMVIGAIALGKKKALIRYLPAVETLGSCDIIASDKTGTITEGNLIVKEVYAPSLDIAKMIAALCNDAEEGCGDPLDLALAGWVDGYMQIRSRYPRLWSHAFDVQRMLMATVHEIDGKKNLLLKGAFEALAKRAKNWQEYQSAYEDFLQKGLRVLAFGISPWEHDNPDSWEIEIAGVIGFLDPPKPGIQKAVIAAQNAGIRVLMLTGDHPDTAKFIAKEVSIFSPKDLIVTGDQIEKMTQQQRLFSLNHAAIFARILPEHKYEIVKQLQQQGKVVAVTGDGINDVPALKVADIGIAMGSGSEAAKQASKMVITDNNLSVIVDAIRNARVIADGIRKVIFYLVSTSLQEVSLIGLSILASLPLPLSAIEILWINIVTDGVQDKTFACTKAEGDVMQRPPRKAERQFFDTSQILRILYMSATTGVFCFFLYKYLLDLYPFNKVSTIVFTSLVLAQWAHGIQAQKEREPFFKNIKRSITINPWIYGGLILGLGLQCLAIYSLTDLFHLSALGWQDWSYPIITFLAAFAFAEARKWVEWLVIYKKSAST